MERQGLRLLSEWPWGAVGGYLYAASQVTSAKAETKEARGYQSEFATENSKLSSENRLLEERMKKMESNSYDRQAITSCMMVSSILSSAVSAHLTGQELLLYRERHHDAVHVVSNRCKPWEVIVRRR